MISYQSELEKNIINHIVNIKSTIKEEENQNSNLNWFNLNNTKQILLKKEETDYLKTIELIIYLKIERDKIYSIEFSKDKLI